MPFKSENQRRYLWAKHPEIARRWSKEYGGKVAAGKQLPPWMQGKKQQAQSDPKMDARKKVAANRLAKLKAQPKGK
jgi:hypothetical protein